MADNKLIVYTAGYLPVQGPASAAGMYGSREEAESSNVPPVLQSINVGGLQYVRDPNGTALTTGDGSTWSPAGKVTTAHWGSPMNGVDDDTPFIQAAIDWANDQGINEVEISGDNRVSTIYLYGETAYFFGGTTTAIGTEGFAVEIAQTGTVQRQGKVHDISIVGNETGDGGVLLTAAQYWTFYDPTISGFSKVGSWAFAMSGNESNQNASSNVIINPNFSNCHNLIKFGKNPEIVGSQNTGSSFNTIIGGFLGPYGDNTDDFQYGVLDEVGEGNKAINCRVSTNKHHTVDWEIMDSRTQLIGCAGDGPCFTAFVYPLDGTGTIDSITLLGTPLLTTPVPWQGTRQLTADAISDQIAIDAPDAPFIVVSYDEQVMFFRDDGAGNKVRLNTSEIGNISVSATGMTVGHSGINSGLLQGPPYVSYPDVKTNKWGYRCGHGGVLEVFGFRFRSNPEGSGSGGGSLIEPEGNGPRHIVWFDTDTSQSRVNVVQAGSNILGGSVIATDGVSTNLDGQIQAVSTSGNVSYEHAQQRLRIQNFGPMVFAEILLRFTPTITTNGNLWIELPQIPGVYNTTTPISETGLRFYIPVTVGGTSLTSSAYLAVFGGGTSPNGHPYARLISSVGNTTLSTSIFTSGQEVSIQGWGNWPVNRF